MLLLPIPNSLGVVDTAEVILVLGPGQPGAHEFAPSDLAAIGLETILLAFSSSVIGKKKFLAVQALLLQTRLHQLQSQTQRTPENQEKPTKKNQMPKDSTQEETN